ncbi:zinc finger protein 239-like [Mobula hypostoma]|uniref:zinc finger protein 239-like n=1 Tax=Mobula hypostoma TaxID=723540 RepID=UPI002FC3B0C4
MATALHTVLSQLQKKDAYVSVLRNSPPVSRRSNAHAYESQLDSDIAHALSEQKALSERAQLTIHQKIHTSERLFTCSVSESRFSHSADPQTDQRVHKGERFLNCFVCGKTFTETSDLLTNERIHLRERPFPCSDSGKGFSQSFQLKVHQ